MENIIGVSGALSVLKNVCKSTKEILSPVCIRNLGVRNNFNHIEIFNSGKNFVQNVSVQIMKYPVEDCWWEHPNNSDKQKLLISYIEPQSHFEQELMFTYFNDAEVPVQIIWDDWLGFRHSKSINLHLEGLCEC